MYKSVLTKYWRLPRAQKEQPAYIQISTAHAIGTRGFSVGGIANYRIHASQSGRYNIQGLYADNLQHDFVLTLCAKSSGEVKQICMMHLKCGIAFEHFEILLDNVLEVMSRYSHVTATLTCGMACHGATKDIATLWSQLEAPALAVAIDSKLSKHLLKSNYTIRYHQSPQVYIGFDGELSAESVRNLHPNAVALKQGESPYLNSYVQRRASWPDDYMGPPSPFDAYAHREDVLLNSERRRYESAQLEKAQAAINRLSMR